MSFTLRAASCEYGPDAQERQAGLVIDSPLAARRSPLSPRGAFTLLELILVLLVVGLGASLAAARLSGMRGAVGVDMAAQSLVDQARRCQHLAATSGQAVRMRLDLSGHTLDIALMDGAKEQEPKDGEPARVLLSQSADDLTIGFARGDALKNETTEDTIDLLFSPDQRCDPAGIVTFTSSAPSSAHSASVRLSAGARLPALIADTVTDSKVTR